MYSEKTRPKPEKRIVTVQSRTSRPPFHTQTTANGIQMCRQNRENDPRTRVGFFFGVILNPFFFSPEYVGWNASTASWAACFSQSPLCFLASGVDITTKINNQLQFCQSDRFFRFGFVWDISLKQNSLKCQWRGWNPQRKECLNPSCLLYRSNNVQSTMWRWKNRHYPTQDLGYLRRSIVKRTTWLSLMMEQWLKSAMTNCPQKDPMSSRWVIKYSLTALIHTQD